METINVVMSAIGSVGFPIVMCLLMYKSNQDTQKQHAEETKELSKAIENNTIAIEKMTERMDNVNR